MDILITGIHTGLGKALATQALDEGHHVLAMGRVRPVELEGHERLRFVTIDLLEHERIPDALRRLLGELTRLDLAILNAGMLGQIKDLADTGLDELRRVMDLNVWANKAIQDDPRWDAQARIRLARDEGRVITADQAARGLLSSLHVLRREPSGSFVDLRTIES